MTDTICNASARRSQHARLSSTAMTQIFMNKYALSLSQAEEIFLLGVLFKQLLKHSPLPTIAS